MALQLKQRRSLISMKLAGAFLAVFALFVQPLVTLNIPAAFAVAGIPGQIVVNEFSSGTGHDDWVELYNTTGAAANLSGWKLKDATVNTKGLSGTIPAHGFVSFDFSNKLDGSGDTIRVEDDAGATINTVTYGSGGSVAAPSASQFAARITDGSSTWELRTTDSRNATNNTVIASPDLVAQDFGIWDNSPSFKGFNVGFAAANFGEVTSVELDVTREDGSHVIRTGRTDMLAHLSDKTTLTQGSAPFVVNPGTSDGLSDSSWWSGQTNVAWTAATKPVSVKITVVGEHGTKSVTNNTFTNSAPGYENILPPQIEACNDSTFDGFTLGSVNGQAGWKATNPNFDQEVENNTYGYEAFGCKSLRLSNSYTSGSFGDQTFSASAATLAGESAANDHYEATFSFGSTKQHQQSGLALSVSPDDGNGNRMSYVGLADQAGGITLTFYDTDENGTFVATPLTTVSRTEAHTIKFVIDMIDGESNDVVKIYLDGSLVHTGTTWEQYYRESPEQAGNGNVVPSIDRLLLRSAGTAVSANDGNGYLFDNVLVSTSKNDTQPPQVTFVSPGQNAYVQNLKVDVDMDGTGSNLVRYGFDVAGPDGLGFSTHNYNVDQPTVELNDFDLCAAQNYGDDCPAQLPNGTYTIRAKAYDAAGNRNISTTLKVTVDTTKPKATLKSSSVGSVSQKILKEADFSLSDNYKVRAYIINGHRVLVSPNKFSDANDIKVGARHGVYGENTIEVEDMAGNVSDPFVFTLDNVEPTINVKDNFVGDEDAKIFSNVSFSLYDLYKVNKYIINGHVSDFTDNKWSDANFQNIKAYLVQGGGNTLVLHDVAGNSKTFNFTYDSNAPTAVSITYSNNNGNALTNDDVVATLTIDEAVRDITGWTRVSDTEFTKEFSSNGTFSVDFMDLAGNPGTATGEVKRIDRNAPTIAGVSDGAVVKGTVHLSIFDPKYQNYDGFNKDSGLTINGIPTPTTETSDKHYEVDVTGEGTYTVIATDKAGNASAPIIFRIDNTSPILTDLMAVQNDDNRFTLSVITNDPATVKFEVDDVEVPGASGQDNGNGTWTWSVVTGVLPVSTNHPFSASTVDAAGNPNTESDTFFVQPPETTTIDDDSTPFSRQLAGATTTPTTDLFATTGSDTAVSNEDDSDEGEVLGTQNSSSPAENAALAPSDQGWKLWGVAWYWWLLAAAALAAIWWMIAAWRRRQAEADPSAGL